MKILRRAGYRQMPWKNGQGLTEEVLTFPESSAVDAFDWRISIAHVGADGPFSLFPGIDRTIALLEGAGLILDLPDESEHLLSPGGTPFPFPGEWQISSRNVNGGTMDLNVMTRRGRFAHRMERLVFEAESRITAKSIRFLVPASAGSIMTQTEEVRFGPFDCLMIEDGESCILGPVSVSMLDIDLWAVA